MTASTKPSVDTTRSRTASSDDMPRPNDVGSANDDAMEEEAVERWMMHADAWCDVHDFFCALVLSKRAILCHHDRAVSHVQVEHTYEPNTISAALFGADANSSIPWSGGSIIQVEK
jgi:hypothetical protein